MVVRGAPAIGLRRLGVALAASQASAGRDAWKSNRGGRAGRGATDRVNLAWAINRMRRVAAETPPAQLAEALEAEAARIHDEDLAACRAMGRHGAVLVADGATVLTHCNAGGLATAGYGTALGVIRAAVEEGKRVRVLADETRPFLQGSRLTAWELMKDGIDVSLITDNMAGAFLHRGEVDLVVVGADRIAANGDVANKIGTYSVAVLAKENGVPFYVAAPRSTIDLACPDGNAIPIEERDPAEVTAPFGHPIAPAGVSVRNPAFDVTPARYVAGIVTEVGIARPPYSESLQKLFAKEERA
jgi:methylthioribose-1-phosphate isomerase